MSEFKDKEIKMIEINKYPVYRIETKKGIQYQIGNNKNQKAQIWGEIPATNEENAKIYLKHIIDKAISDALNC